MKASRRASASSKLALEFLVLTAARSGEVRKATWDEIDVEGATWTVPAERMKANREHRVPLSGRALEVLAEAADLSPGSGLVFPGARSGRPLSENTHAKLLRELGFDAVTHGFRSSFRDYAAEQEQTHTAHAVMEAALAHTIKNKTEAAYARSDLFEKRRMLMESWAHYLAAWSPSLLTGKEPESVALNTGTPRPFPKVNGYLLIAVDEVLLVGQVEWLTVERSAFPKRLGMQDYCSMMEGSWVEGGVFPPVLCIGNLIVIKRHTDVPPGFASPDSGKTRAARFPC